MPCFEGCLECNGANNGDCSRCKEGEGFIHDPADDTCYDYVCHDHCEVIRNDDCYGGLHTQCNKCQPNTVVVETPARGSFEIFYPGPYYIDEFGSTIIYDEVSIP